MQDLILNADFHLHTKEDPLDKYRIKYNAYQLIDNLQRVGIDVFSITLHEGMYDNSFMEKIRKYSKRKGLIYIPGIEQNIEGKHIVILNMSKEIAENIKTYKALRLARKKFSKDTLVIGVHPFFPGSTSSKDKIFLWKDSIDAIEYSSFYMRFLNFNKQATSAAKKLDKPVLGNTDAHILEQIGKTYTEIKIPTGNGFKEKSELKKYVAKCTDEQYNRLISQIIVQIKKGKVDVKTRPYTSWFMFKTFFQLIFNL